MAQHSVARAGHLPRRLPGARLSVRRAGAAGALLVAALRRRAGARLGRLEHEPQVLHHRVAVRARVSRVEQRPRFRLRLGLGGARRRARHRAVGRLLGGDAAPDSALPAQVPAAAGDDSGDGGARVVPARHLARRAHRHGRHRAALVHRVPLHAERHPAQRQLPRRRRQIVPRRLRVDRHQPGVHRARVQPARAGAPGDGVVRPARLLGDSGARGGGRRLGARRARAAARAAARLHPACPARLVAAVVAHRHRRQRPPRARAGAAHPPRAHRAPSRRHPRRRPRRSRADHDQRAGSAVARRRHGGAVAPARRRVVERRRADERRRPGGHLPRHRRRRRARGAPRRRAHRRGRVRQPRR